MDRRDDNYYEANAADISLEDITSSEHNARTLRRLRDDKLSHLRLRGQELHAWWYDFQLGEGDDLGWLGYFIGRSECLRKLTFQYGIGCFELGNLLESSVSKLILLDSNGIDDAGVAAFAHGLRSIGPSLKELDLANNSIGNEGLSALVAALVNCTSLERLNLSYNDFSAAAAGLGSLSDWLQIAALNLHELHLRQCDINDEGLQALAGTVNRCKDLDLSGNRSITASGLRYLSTSLRSVNCCLEYLYLGWMDIVNGGAEVLARGLVGNKVLRRLHLRVDGQEHLEISPAGLNAFSTALCDTSTINNTYLSNHTIQQLYYWDWDQDDYDNADFIDESVVLYLGLNKEHPEHAARCKILMNHPNLNMTPLLQWELKFLPLAVGWFEKAQPCTTLSILDINTRLRRRILEESEQAFQSRVLTALFQFVRGMPKKVLERRDELALVAAYDDKIAMVEEESDRKITQLEEENKRLRGIMKSMRNALDKALEE
eukprot:scaffold37330_cov144-Skeletonema_dohrnii-CCMP3373.AAC.1